MGCGSWLVDGEKRLPTAVGGVAYERRSHGVCAVKGVNLDSPTIRTVMLSQPPPASRNIDEVNAFDHPAVTHVQARHDV